MNDGSIGYMFAGDFYTLNEAYRELERNYLSYRRNKCSECACKIVAQEA